MEPEKPTAVLSVGQGGGWAQISLGLVGININDARTADSAGNSSRMNPTASEGSLT
ncbi:MAG: hypothetical protein M1299_13250 [Firmicutes bacterium]|nr:hypothetical protein [Bacillota bacterium]